MCFLTVSSRPCLETNPHSTLWTPFAGHCLGALWGGKPCPAELSEGLSRVLRTLSGDPPLPILQTPSAGHCLDTHGFWNTGKPNSLADIQGFLPGYPGGARRVWEEKSCVRFSSPKLVAEVLGLWGWVPNWRWRVSSLKAVESPTDDDEWVRWRHMHRDALGASTLVLRVWQVRNGAIWTTPKDPSVLKMLRR